MHYVKSRALQAMLRLVSRRGVAPVRRRLGLPLGPAARGGTCRPVAQLFANSFHLEAPQPLGPPQVRAGRGFTLLATLGFWLASWFPALCPALT